MASMGVTASVRFPGESWGAPPRDPHLPEEPGEPGRIGHVTPAPGEDPHVPYVDQHEPASKGLLQAHTSESQRVEWTLENAGRNV